MSNSFNTQEFLDWLDQQDSPVPKSTLYDEYPDFPSHRMIGVTCPLSDDGEISYFHSDLKSAAQGRYPRD